MLKNYNINHVKSIALEYGLSLEITQRTSDKYPGGSKRSISIVE